MPPRLRAEGGVEVSPVGHMLSRHRSDLERLQGELGRARPVGSAATVVDWGLATLGDPLAEAP